MSQITLMYFRNADSSKVPDGIYTVLSKKCGISACWQLKSVTMRKDFFRQEIHAYLPDETGFRELIKDAKQNRTLATSMQKVTLYAHAPLAIELRILIRRWPGHIELDRSQMNSTVALPFELIHDMHL